MKVVADETLAEVRRKVTDVKRSLETLKALQKLRQLRQEAAVKKGKAVLKIRTICHARDLWQLAWYCT